MAKEPDVDEDGWAVCNRAWGDQEERPEGDDGRRDNVERTEDRDRDNGGGVPKPSARDWSKASDDELRAASSEFGRRNFAKRKRKPAGEPGGGA